jgi:hypothetical protein
MGVICGVVKGVSDGLGSGSSSAGLQAVVMKARARPPKIGNALEKIRGLKFILFLLFGTCPESVHDFG